jgi:hypothetical protein
MSNIDPDLIPMLDAEAKASIEFNGALFEALKAADDRVAVWQKLTRALQG